MNEDDKTGGPAFPLPDTTHSNGQIEYGCSGMTLRDYFAAKAMEGMIMSNYAHDFAPEAWANHAYIVANAMLKARKS